VTFMMNPSVSPLLTDLYQLTMLQGYLKRGMNDRAVFEFSVRRLPESRKFLLAAGLDSALTFLEEVRFSEEELAYVEATGRFSREVLDYLRDFRFSGDVHAMPEGTVFFPDEPVIRVTAPLPMAQLVETRIINLIHLQTLLASKAARCVLAAAARAILVDFGLRRAHGAEAGLFAARSAYLAGFVGSSTVLAEALYGIPAFGTMAHSFVEAHGDEREAFIDFSRANPGNTTMLIDTYDTLEGARKVIEAARRLEKEGIAIRAVRLDSGDLLDLSKKVRKVLDDGGLGGVGIFASGDIDEYMIQYLLGQGAPINGFGVGTKLDTSSDASYLNCAYKLMEYGGKARMKKSEDKTTWPGPKQVFRIFRGGIMERDVISLEGEREEGEPLLQPVMAGGRRIASPEKLDGIRTRSEKQLHTLPQDLRALEHSPPYPVRISPALERLRADVEKTLT
jgi:nicotinate phosphoribosyltransferase